MVLAPHGYGSSPLARGARGHGRRHHLVPGIIPARAGSTPRRPTAAARPPDHPRSRGEHSAPPAPSMTRLGSSPLARGARRGPSGAQGLDGIIPARAGSTMTLQRRPKWPRDHPRSRGEHRCSSLLMPFYVGSSPLARGALQTYRLGRCADGIIPARAGSTRTARSAMRSHGDHPRSRGEHMFGTSSQMAHNGSSPLARGARDLLRSAVTIGGIIPARAGSTLGNQQL